MKAPKALCRLWGKTFIERALAAVDLPSVSRCAVVLGHEAKRIAPHVLTGDIVIHGGWRSGRTGSIKVGLAALGVGFDAILIHQVDFPLVDAGVVRTLVKACSDDAMFCIPTYRNRRGHPLLVCSSMVAEIQALDDDAPLRDLLRRHQARGRLVPVETPGVLINVNDPNELARVAASLTG